MYCPSRDDTLASLLALLPRGRAWQTNEGGPEPYVDAAFDPNAFDPAAFDTFSVKGSTLYRFWEAVAIVFTFATDRLCALASEMFCATRLETKDQWLTEFALPDPCDPFPDLCSKVAAIGGARCEYFNDIVSRLGWKIDCVDLTEGCGDRVGCARSGHLRTGNRFPNRLLLIVDLDHSPAYGGQLQAPARSGCWRMGRPLACGPNLTPLQCIVDRIAPAHLEIQYLTT